MVSYEVCDQSRYFNMEGIPHQRQKVTENLLGDRRFCPMIRLTDTLKEGIDLQLDKKGMEVVGNYSAEVLHRAVSYLYTKETKSSFEIERAAPDQKRAARFVELLRLAHDREFFNKASLIELQQVTHHRQRDDSHQEACIQDMPGQPCFRLVIHLLLDGCEES